MNLIIVQLIKVTDKYGYGYGVMLCAILNSRVVISMYDKIVNYWVGHKKETEEDYNRILSRFWLLSTCHSNNIEDGRLNYRITREVFEGSELTMVGVFTNDIVEAQNSRFTKRKIVENIVAGNKITPELIKMIHKSYMTGLYSDRRYDRGERPGLFKVNDYCVGLTDEGSLPENVESDIIDLCREVEIVDSNRMLEVAAYFHLMFESIHPFSDGNGRVGRLMMNYLLMLNNHPPINIFSEDKETYYLGLEVFDRMGEISGFVQFLKEQCIKTWFDTIKNSCNKLPTLKDAIDKMGK